MAKYCDPILLKKVWHNFIVANNTPQLEQLRCAGSLFTKDHGDRFEHCIATTTPHYFDTINGKTSEYDIDLALKSSCFPLNIVLIRGLLRENFLFDKSIFYNWNALSDLIYKICCGVALNFHLPEDAKNELIHEALLYTLSKIRRGKLTFDHTRPSPPFNLLTTAIFRIMYSIKNKEKRIREHQSNLINKMLDGSHLPDFNSMRVAKSLIPYAQIKIQSNY